MEMKRNSGTYRLTFVVEMVFRFLLAAIPLK